MPIATASGFYYPTEMEMELNHPIERTPRQDPQPIDDYTLDPVSGPYNDQPTDEAKARQGQSQYQMLKDNEKLMEDTLAKEGPEEAIDPAQPMNMPKNVADLPIRANDTFKSRFPKSEQDLAQDAYGAAAYRTFRGVVKNVPEPVQQERSMPEVIRDVGRAVYELVDFPRKVMDGEIDLEDPHGRSQAIEWAINIALGGVKPTKAMIDSPVNLGFATRALEQVESRMPLTYREQVQNLATQSRYITDHELMEMVRARTPEAARRPISDFVDSQGRMNWDALLEESRSSMSRVLDQMDRYQLRSSGRSSAAEAAIARRYNEANRIDELVEAAATYPDRKMKFLSFENDKGVKGSLFASQAGDTIKVHSIGGPGGTSDFAMLHTLGVSGVRKILSEVRAAFPDAKYIEGFRVTGAQMSRPRNKVMALPEK